MRISDWSSDVCSSDLPPAIREIAAPALSRREKRHEIGSIARTKVGGEMTAPCYYIHERRKQAASIRRVGRYLMAEMIDPFGREITYQRVSVTERCEFRSEEHTSELKSLMSRSYDVHCLNKKN